MYANTKRQSYLYYGHSLNFSNFFTLPMLWQLLLVQVAVQKFKINNFQANTITFFECVFVHMVALLNIIKFQDVINFVLYSHLTVVLSNFLW